MSSVIPRYLYHLTSKSNYKQIISSGFLKTSKPESACNGGVFMLELTNFFKRWGTSKNWEGNMQKELLFKVGANDAGDVVILRIPTKRLDINKLRVRSQNRLNEFVKLNNDGEEKLVKLQQDYIKSELSKLDTSVLSTDEYINKCHGISQKAMEKFPFPEERLYVPISEHIVSGAPAKERKLFQQRKEAIEYIYPNEIPASVVEKIGETNVDDILLPAEKCSLINIFSRLLRGTPEAKTTLLLNA